MIDGDGENSQIPKRRRTSVVFMLAKVGAQDGCGERSGHVNKSTFTTDRLGRGSPTIPYRRESNAISRCQETGSIHAHTIEHGRLMRREERKTEENR